MVVPNRESRFAHCNDNATLPLHPMLVEVEDEGRRVGLTRWNTGAQ
jgi:hypothetical protein